MEAAHPGLWPKPFSFAEPAPWLAESVNEGVEIRSAWKASHHSNHPFGYYKIEARDGRIYFGKVVTESRLKRLLQAEQIARSLHREKIRVSIMAMPPIQIGGGFLVLTEWSEGQFFSGLAREMRFLGQVLGSCHRVLRVEAGPEVARWPGMESFETACETLLLDSGCSAEEKKAIEEAIGEREERWFFLKSDCHRIHNDLHVGNILFQGGEVSQLLDFEEAVESVLNPAVDMIWVFERFCLLSPFSSRGDLVSAFVSGYEDSGEKLPAMGAREIAMTFRWKSLIGLTQLHKSGLSSRSDPAWQLERSKFSKVLESAEWLGNRVAQLLNQD